MKLLKPIIAAIALTVIATPTLATSGVREQSDIATVPLILSSALALSLFVNKAVEDKPESN